jgi:hypothetical protein
MRRKLEVKHGMNSLSDAYNEASYSVIIIIIIIKTKKIR